MGLMSLMMMMAVKPRLYKFMTEFEAYLSRPGSSTDFMGPVRSIKRVVGDSSDARNYYEIVFRA
jgi:hypothetical protein